MSARQMTLRRTRDRTITKRQETAFAVVIALLGFLVTVLLLANFDDFRFAFAEWGQDDTEVSAPLSD
jgi:hypothetical protein